VDDWCQVAADKEVVARCSRESRAGALDSHCTPTCPRSPICFSGMAFSSTLLKGQTTWVPDLASSDTTYLPMKPVAPKTVAQTPVAEDLPPGPPATPVLLGFRAKV
jgi:hypothetical protein